MAPALMSGNWCKPLAMIPHSPSHGPSASNKRDQMSFAVVLRRNSITKAEIHLRSQTCHFHCIRLVKRSPKANPASSWIEIDSTSPSGASLGQHVGLAAAAAFIFANATTAFPGVLAILTSGHIHSSVRDH